VQIQSFLIIILERCETSACAAAFHAISACVWKLLGFFFATLHLTFACHAQHLNKITSLDGVVFPAGLTELWLVSFHYFRHCFVVYVCDVRGACCADVA
jgi:hypothetical protein